MEVLEHRVSELLRDKKRMEELLAIRDSEIHKVKEESGHALHLLEQAKHQMLKQEDVIRGL